MIIAFILFIGFLSFGLYFFNPLNSNRVLDSSLFYTFDEILANASSPLLTYGVSLNTIFSGAVQEISFPLSRENVPGEGYTVVSADGRVLRSNYNAGILSISRDDSEFFYVRFGEFTPNPVPISDAHTLEEDIDYSLSSSDRAVLLSETKLLALNKSYYESYDDVREIFNLPRRIDFAVEATFGPLQTLLLTRPVPEGFDVLAKTERKEVVLQDGRVVFADITVKVW